MVDALRRLHGRLSLGAGFACLLVALGTGTAVAFALFVIGFGLILDGATLTWARSARSGGLPDHRQ
jgi:hypothetical protein